MNEAPEKSTARVFFALWPETTGRDALADWQRKLKEVCGGREMRPDTLHATLLFLGEIATHRLEALKLAAEEISTTPFALCFDEARYWGHNHIVYAAPSIVPPELLNWVRELQQHLLRHHFPFERHEYKPHVTLLRNAHWNDEPLPGMSPVHWQVNGLVLVQSAPHNGEAHYQTLAKIPCPNSKK